MARKMRDIGVAAGKVFHAEAQRGRGAEKMKPSGIPWIGDIPVGWEVGRVKAFFKQEKRPTRPDDEIITAFRDGQVTLRKNRRTTGFTEATNYDSYQGIRKGDLVIHQMDAFAGCAGISDSDGMGSPILIACTPRRSDIEPRYYAEIVRIMGHSGFISALAKGVRERSADFRFETFAKQLLPLPPLPEQRAIAAYLDEKCAAIDAAVAEAKKGIEEYKAWKKSLIFEAVTGKRRVGAFNAETQKGGGAEKMKPSGIPWIGAIPEGWEVSRVKLHYELILGKMLCSTPSNDANIRLPYVCAANVHFDGVTLGNLKEMWFSDLEVNQYEIREGDLLVVEGGAGAGGAAICPEFEGHIGIQNSILLVRNRHCRDNRYLRYLLETLVKDGYVDFVCNKATIPHFTKEKLGNVPLPIPLLAEQKAIADYLDEKCAAIDALVAEKEALIADLEAYKKSLIFEVVTGKREVA